MCKLYFASGYFILKKERLFVKVVNESAPERVYMGVSFRDGNGN